METLVIIGFVVLALMGFMSWQTALGSIGMFIVLFGVILPLAFMAVMAITSSMRK